MQKKINYFISRKRNWAFIAIVIFLLSAYFASTKKEKDLLIIGCARSGTNYIANLLEKGGLQIGHERMKKNGISSWYLTPGIHEKKRRVNPDRFHFAHVFHQVRDPLKTISSIYTTENRHSWNYIMKHVPEIKVQDSHLVKCAKYWYYWNLQAERKAEWTYRVEDIENVFKEFCQKLGKPIKQKALLSTPKNVNHRGPHLKEFTWEDLQKELDHDLFEKLQKLAQKYGYSI